MEKSEFEELLKNFRKSVKNVGDKERKGEQAVTDPLQKLVLREMKDEFNFLTSKT